MQKHWHSGAEMIVVYGLSAMIFFHVMRIIAAPMSKQAGLVGTTGRVLGGLFTFGGQTS